MSTVFERVVEIIHKHQSELVIENEIKPETKFVEFGTNSISFIKIIVDVENEFDIEFDDEKLSTNDFQTVQDLCNYIDANMKEE